MTEYSTAELPREIGGIRLPDSALARRAYTLAREVSPPMLLNHVMRSYVFGRLLHADAANALDEEAIFVAAVLHDLGLTEHARGPRRFEIEGADAARRFVEEQGVESARSWLIWDIIALHPWGDINFHKEPEAGVVQAGIMSDVAGFGQDRIDETTRSSVLAALPRLGFKSEFFELLRHEAVSKPDTHVVHPVHMIAEHCCYRVPIPDAKAIIAGAPFPD